MKQNRIWILFFGVIITSMLVLAFTEKDMNNSYEDTISQVPHQQFNSKLSESIKYEHLTSNPESYSQINRTQVLKTKVKGYREATYWGSEHPIDDKIKHLNDSEFKKFIHDNVELKDSEVYWGAEY